VAASAASPTPAAASIAVQAPGPTLDISQADWSKLLRAGFAYPGDFLLTDTGQPGVDVDVPAEPGLYAIVHDQTVVYIGVTARTLRQRMADYRRGHEGHRTSARVHKRSVERLSAGERLRLLCATPQASEWNGLPVVTAPGLEAGLITALKPAWNMQGLKQG